MTRRESASTKFPGLVRVVVTVLGASTSAAQAVPFPTTVTFSTYEAHKWFISGAGAFDEPATAVQGVPGVISFSGSGTRAGPFITGASAGAFDGLWWADYQFQVPEDAENIHLEFSGLQADDRVVLVLNDSLNIGNQVGFGPGGAGTHAFEWVSGHPDNQSFTFSNATSGDVFGSGAFKRGEDNSIRLVVNNNAQRPLTGDATGFCCAGDSTVARVSGAITYDSYQIAPNPNILETIDVDVDPKPHYNAQNFLNKGTIEIAGTLENRSAGILNIYMGELRLSGGAYWNYGVTKVEALGKVDGHGFVSLMAGSSFDVNGVLSLAGGYEERMEIWSDARLSVGKSFGAIATVSTLQNDGTIEIGTYGQLTVSSFVNREAVSNRGRIGVDGGTVDNQGQITNASEEATLKVSGTGTLQNHNELSNYGRLENFGTYQNFGLLKSWHQVLNGGHFENTGTVFIDHDVSNPSGFVNLGTLTNKHGGQIHLINSEFVQTAGHFDNSGLLNQSPGGAIRIMGGDMINWQQGAILNSEIIEIGASARLENRGHLKLSVGAIIDGTLSNERSGEPSSPALIDMIDGAYVVLRGNFVNNGGEVNIRSGATIAGGIYSQSSGLTTINGSVQSDVWLEGGVLTGSSHIAGSIVHFGPDAIVRPGNSAGTMFIVGADVRVDGATLDIEIADYNNYDRIAVIGGFSMFNGARVNLQFLPGYEPDLNDRIEWMPNTFVMGADTSIYKSTGLSPEWMIVNPPDPVVATSLWTPLAYQISATSAFGFATVVPSAAIAYNSLTPFLNISQLSVDGALANLASAALFNSGSLDVQSSGRLTNRGQITNSSGSTLSNAGRLENRVGGTVTNSGSIRNSGTLINDGLIENTAVGEIKNQTAGTLSNRGLFEQMGTLLNDGQLVNASPSSIFHVRDAGAVRGMGTYIQQGGQTRVDGMLAASLLDIQDGTFSGVGTVQGQMTAGSGAVIAPGNSIGVLTVDGNLVTNGNAFEIELHYSGSDLLKLLGDLDVTGGGDVNYLLGDGYLPTAGEHFDWLQVSGATTGDFDALDFSIFMLDALGNKNPWSAPSGLIWQTHFDGSVARLEFTSVAAPVPVPYSFVLFASGLVGLVGASRAQAGKHDVHRLSRRSSREQGATQGRADGPALRDRISCCAPAAAA